MLPNPFDFIRQGISQTQENNHHLRYHNGFHAQMALEGFEKIANLALKAGKISDEGYLAGMFCMSWHDLIQGKGSPLNEQLSAETARNKAVELGFPIAIAEQTYTGILATICTFEESGVMHQQGEQMNGYLYKLIADSDLCSIGTPTKVYQQTAEWLGQEVAKKDTLTSEEWRKWWQGQVKFLTDRNFLTSDANHLWGKNIQKNLKFATKMANQ